MKQFQKAIIVVLLATVLLFSCLTTAMAADSNLDDLTTAKLYLTYYSFYPPADEVLKADTIEKLVELQGKCDKWIRYYNKENFATYQNKTFGEMVGMGIYFEVRDGKVVIMGTVPNSPAAASDLQEGDILLSANGKLLEGLTKEEVSRELAGEVGYIMTIVYERDGKQYTETFIYKEFSLELVAYHLLDNNIGYIQISQFAKDTSAQLDNALKDLRAKGAESLIIDLRNNPGGMVNSVNDCIGAFVPEGPAFFVKYKTSEGYYPTGNWPEMDLPYAVLVNSETASAAEIFASAVQDVGNGVIIGVNTFGKALMQNVYSLPEGGGFVFTVAKIYSRNYRDLDKQGGIVPDIYVEGAEKQMQAAKNYLVNQRAKVSSITYYINQKTALFGNIITYIKEKPFQVGGSSYLPLRRTLEGMGYEVNYKNGELYIIKNSFTMVLNMGTEQYRVKQQNLKTDIIEKDGTAYLPASFFRQALGMTVTWQSHKQAVELKFGE
ncbi:MAG: S41 family peptidase [Clostridia bacterium]|nr:S41 family peptidase [Clostridia bacterium]